MKILCLAVPFLCLQLSAQIAPEALKPGLGSFTFADATVNQGRPLRVWYSLPAAYREDAPVLLVMHGVNRDAERYRDDWREVAARQGAVLLCPEFSRDGWPTDGQYNFGNVYAEVPADCPLPAPLPESSWSYAYLDPLFAAVSARLRLRTPGFLLYGHSAGSQFVHRLPFFKPATRALRIVSANAGWYMFPEPAVRFPHGLQGTGIGPARVKQALALPVTILLGDQDTDPEHRNLRRTVAAGRQGRFRLERGQAFFAAARRQAELLKTPFNWQLVIAPGVGHDDKKMAPFAEKVLFPPS